MTKTYAFAVNNNSCEINFQRQTLPCSSAVKILGVKFYLVDGGVAFYFSDANLKFVEPALAESKLQSSFWARPFVIAGAIIIKVNYGSEIRHLDDTQEQNLKNSISGSVWGSTSLKATNIMFTQAALASRWMNVCRSVRNDPSLGDVPHRNHFLREHQRLHKSGPGEAQFSSSTRLRLSYETSSSVR